MAATQALAAKRMLRGSIYSPRSCLSIFYDSAWILAVKAASSAMSSSLVGAGNSVRGTYAASSASLAASSSAVNGIGPSAVM